MDREVIDLDRPFSDVFKALDLKEQRKAIRGALGKMSRRVQKVVLTRLLKCGIGPGTIESLSKGVMARVYPSRYGSGFMTRVSPIKKYDSSVMHVNRYGKEKPVLMWAADGTKLRHVTARTEEELNENYRKRGKVSGRDHYGHSTGRMPKFDFMVKEEDGSISFVEKDLFADFQKNVLNAARKQGLL